MPNRTYEYPSRKLAIATDLAARRIQLERWLGDRLAAPDHVSITALVPPASDGASSETYLVDAAIDRDGVIDRRAFVARFEPKGPGVYPEYDIGQQFGLLRALKDHTSLPVATALWLETDRSVAGAPFYMMDRLAGRAPTDFPPIHAGGWFYDLPSIEQRRLWFAGIKAMAGVHAVDWRAPGLKLFDRPQFGAAGPTQQIGYLRHYLRWAAQGEAHPAIEGAFGWLEARAPASTNVQLLWGDARFGNVFFADQGKPYVLDWEVSWLGDPATDIAWWFAADYASSVGANIGRLASLPTHEESIAYYESLTNRRLTNLGYHLILAVTLDAITMIRIAALIGGPSDVVSQMAQDNAMTHLLIELLDADGEVQVPPTTKGMRHDE